MDELRPFLFWSIALLTGVCAVAVVVTQNIVRSATWLLFTLGGTAGLFFLLGADFVGATQLLVYVGGTLVLVIFGVMLTAQGPFITMKTSAAEWAVSTVVGLLLLGVLSVSAVTSGKPEPRGPVKEFAPRRPLSNDPAATPDTDQLGLTLLGIPLGPAHREPDPARPGEVRIVRTHYFLPFIIVSVHLLVVLIGAAYLARAKRRRGAAA
jgi:NADH:ubiquinone oxidoreductase subunit 6 (subunit J)